MIFTLEDIKKINLKHKNFRDLEEYVRNLWQGLKRQEDSFEVNLPEGFKIQEIPGTYSWVSRADIVRIGKEVVKNRYVD